MDVVMVVDMVVAAEDGIGTDSPSVNILSTVKQKTSEKSEVFCYINFYN